MVMNARSRSRPGSQLSPTAQRNTAATNEIQTCAFQALVSSRSGIVFMAFSLDEWDKRAHLAGRRDVQPSPSRAWHAPAPPGACGATVRGLADTSQLPPMSTTQDLVHALKAELRAAGVTYADLADALGMSESSVKRVFAKADMPLSRIDEMLRVLNMDFAELARKVADAQPLSRELTVEQEAAVVADRKLLLVAICCLSQWSFEAMTHE